MRTYFAQLVRGLGAADAGEVFPPAEAGPLEAVEVDGVARVFGVPLFQVLGVAGQEVLQPVAVDDEVFHGGRATGGGFEL